MASTSYWPSPPAISPPISNTSPSQRIFELEAFSPLQPIQTSRLSRTNPRSSRFSEQPTPTTPTPHLLQPATSALRVPTSKYSSLASDDLPPLDERKSLQRSSYFSKEVTHTPPSTSSITFYVTRNPFPFLSILPIFSSLTLLLLLLYLASTYLSQPWTANGSRPRLSDQYSLVPYPSCIGSLVLPVYASLTILTFLLLITSFVTTSFITTHSAAAHWLRVLLVATSGGVAIWMVFSSVQVRDRIHLYLGAVKVLADLSVKSMSLLIDCRARRRWPLLKHDGAFRAGWYWKAAILVLAVPMAILTNLGIYICRDTASIQSPGSFCWKIVAASAIADWSYGVLNIVFGLCIAWDVWHEGHYRSAKGVDGVEAKDFEEKFGISSP